MFYDVIVTSFFTFFTFWLKWPISGPKMTKKKLNRNRVERRENKTLLKPPLFGKYFNEKSSFLVDFHAKITKNEQMWTKNFYQTYRFDRNVIFTWKFLFCGVEMLFLCKIMVIIWTILGKNVIFTRKFIFRGFMKKFFPILDIGCFSVLLSWFLPALNRLIFWLNKHMYIFLIIVWIP